VILWLLIEGVYRTETMISLRGKHQRQKRLMHYL
jgi:hypothetical protein